MARSAAAVSPTAYYTGHVWVRHGLAPTSWRTRPGRLMYAALQPAMLASRTVDGPTLESFLLARHRLIDQLLTEAIEAGEVTQVVEIAAGMSPRGLWFTDNYPVRYVETDLPAMAARKRDLLGTRPDHHQVVAADALGTGPGSLVDVLAGLDRSAGVAVISEGLLNYLPAADVRRLWATIAGALAEHPHGRYLSDLHLSGENTGAAARIGAQMIGAFVRGRIHLHFTDTDEAQRVLLESGFTAATLHQPGSGLVRVVDAHAR
ncbi:class I SAM-dependent methyltransferase [Nocardioides limicola]|uniref:class I SAM-dependent methyltransferase n=1 Tax=Nocardioides limicola TaxID=2803368 RepID=UPI00193B5CCF|nr:class I SAM-dependent methyltransferase [Nocardioides sp. DJM-14]